MRQEVKEKNVDTLFACSFQLVCATNAGFGLLRSKIKRGGPLLNHAAREMTEWCIASCPVSPVADGVGREPIAAAAVSTARRSAISLVQQCTETMAGRERSRHRYRIRWFRRLLAQHRREMVRSVMTNSRYSSREEQERSTPVYRSVWRTTGNCHTVQKMPYLKEDDGNVAVVAKQSLDFSAGRRQECAT